MYSSALVAIRRASIESALGQALPLGGLHDYPVGEVHAYQEGMRGLFDKHGQQVRKLRAEEEAFILNEQILGKISYRYWAERYATINLAGQAIGPLYPLWETQELILDQLGDLEFERYESGHPDGVIADLLKDRQVGGSTLIETIIAHRLTTHSHVNGLLASDVPDNSNFLYDIFERCVDHLAWYMKPTITERVKNDEMVFKTGSRLMMGASKSTRGADKTDDGAGKKGQLGRGKTLSMVHQSELATYTNPEQTDTALEPGIPVSPMTFWCKESTAQGRGPHNWWYMDWQTAKSGNGRAKAIFIGWYMEKRRHWLPYPTGWVPSVETLSHAKRIEETSPRWLKGRPYFPTKEQLFWYERARGEATKNDQLELFLQEHPADDEEAFQFSGKSVFPVLLRERVKVQARPLTGMVEIRSHQELGLA